MAYRIPFNKPLIAGRELFYIAKAVTNGQVAADGEYTKLCAKLFEEHFGTRRALLTPSCTAALEMAVMLSNVGPGDEVIMPSYTFVSTASAVVLSGARPVFVDIREDTLNLDESLIEGAITERTKAILPVHYAGVSADMDAIMNIANARGLRVIEDAAQGVNSSYKGKYLGTIGHLGAYSFHETKNYICGEGGALCINDPSLISRAEIIRDKGTNRKAFFRGETDKYTWVDVGSSYVPSEISAAFLWAQLEQLENIASRRRRLFERYNDGLEELETNGLLRRPRIPVDCTSNYHMFYILLPTAELRNRLMDYLRQNGILAVFHYVPLHSSPAGLEHCRVGSTMAATDSLSARLLRLPLYCDLAESDQDEVVDHIKRFLTSAS